MTQITKNTLNTLSPFPQLFDFVIVVSLAHFVFRPSWPGVAVLVTCLAIKGAILVYTGIAQSEELQKLENSILEIEKQLQKVSNEVSTINLKQGFRK